MSGNVENGIQCFRITKAQYDELVAQNNGATSGVLYDLIQAFHLSYNMYPNSHLPYDGYMYAPVLMIDTAGEGDWVLENTDNEIYYFRLSGQWGGSN